MDIDVLNAEQPTQRDIQGAELALLQRRLREAGRPLIVIFEGWGAAGKGGAIHSLIRTLDPRGFSVHTVKEPDDVSKRYPSLAQLYFGLPAYGEIAIFDSSWYMLRAFGAVREDKKLKGDDFIRSVRAFERQLANDGYIICKFFLDITKKTQRQRMDGLLAKKRTKWRVTERDEYQNRHYDDFAEIYANIIDRTDEDYAPWTIIPQGKRADVDKIIFESVKKACDAALTENRAYAPDENSAARLRTPQGLALPEAAPMDREIYEQRKKELKKRLEGLHGLLYLKKVPVLILFEGWDAAGKGGAIKRLTRAFDPRGCEVTPICAPNAAEKAHNYLWRFWNHMPKTGHIAVFDRTWYGRVMVERIEGFCREDEWQRAYGEINEMERYLTDCGAIVLKFFINIDKDEQLRRFESRRDDPERSWKLTDEDWRNREKWPEYETAIREMIEKTDTHNAPWTVVPGNDKLTARIAVMQTVCEAMEKRLCK